VLNIVRRLVESGRRGLPGRGIGAKTGDETPFSQTLLTPAPAGEFTTADVHAFERELGKLHPDNPANNNTGQAGMSAPKSVSSCRCYETLNCCCTSSVFPALRRDKSR